MTKSLITSCHSSYLNYSFVPGSRPTIDRSRRRSAQNPADVSRYFTMSSRATTSASVLPNLGAFELSVHTSKSTISSVSSPSHLCQSLWEPMSEQLFYRITYAFDSMHSPVPMFNWAAYLEWLLFSFHTRESHRKSLASALQKLPKSDLETFVRHLEMFIHYSNSKVKDNAQETTQYGKSHPVISASFETSWLWHSVSV